MDSTSAHVGGHITLLFSVHSTAHLHSKQGSRGAGFCVRDGVEVKASLQERGSGNEAVTIHVSDADGTDVSLHCSDPYSLLLNEFALVGLIELKDETLHLEVKIGLPRSQGFGMSAAGLLAAALSVVELFEIEDEHLAYRFAHRVERMMSSGLGDVLAMSVGGVELRVEPGAPPQPGHAIGFACETPVILVWSPGEGRHTAGYIDDPAWKKRISIAGEEAVARLHETAWDESCWPILLDEAKGFAEQSGMLSEPFRADLLKNVNLTIEEANLEDAVTPQLCMLGASCVIVPIYLESPPSYVSLEALEDALIAQGYGAKLTRIA